MNDTYKVYVQTNGSDNITAVNSDAFLTDATGWTQIDEGIGDKYHHAQGNYFPQPITTDKGIYRYKLANGAVIEKTAGEIEAETAVIIMPPSTEERLAAAEAAITALMGV